jgi:hypothetical protein
MRVGAAVDRPCTARMRREFSRLPNTLVKLGASRDENWSLEAEGSLFRAGGTHS